MTAVMGNLQKSNNYPRPLEGVTVLDMTGALAGPFATLLLAGLGARVIKIENPTAGDSCRSNPPYLGRNGATLTRQNEDDVSISALNRLRNKLGITLNLKNPEAREVFADLVKHADVLVENFSRGTLERLGAGYDRVREINPRMIYCSITGFGSAGDPGSGKAMDAIIQALSGVMMTSGKPAEPPVRVGVPFADMCAPLFGVIGVLAALHQSKSTGIGQHVDISMLGALTMMVACESVRHSGTVRSAAANRANGSAARAIWRVSNERRIHRPVRADGRVCSLALCSHGTAEIRQRASNLLRATCA